MKLDARIDGAEYKVEVEKRGADMLVSLNGRPLVVDSRALEGFFSSLLLDGKAYEVTVEPEGHTWRVQHGIDVHRIEFLDPLRPATKKGEAGGRGSEGRRVATSLMPGKVVRILVKPGDTVEEGQGVAVVEAMKMENEVGSPSAGKVLEIKVAAGDAVEAGAPLLVVG